jgi:transposase
MKRAEMANDGGWPFQGRYAYLTAAIFTRYDDCRNTGRDQPQKCSHIRRRKLTQTKYPETQALLKVYGVGQITARTYVLTLGSKQRFQRSRDVGCYLGLRPRRSQSGDRDPQLGITKAGNVYLRSLLIEGANHMLLPQGKDSSLRRWGLHLAARGGKQAKNRAVVAVARKLAVLLHRIWITQEPYMPFYAEAA